ncbi:MAG: DUF1492 domain-containing protein [Streptococcus sp.]|nr:DUF1492 domain-containing protein [Streptococcus sp.]
MRRAEDVLDELRTLLPYIESLAEERAQLKSSLLSSPKMSDMKTSGGIKKQVDDTYSEIMDLDKELATESRRATERKTEISLLINQLPNHEHRILLRMIYINHFDEWTIRDRLKIGRNRYFKLRRDALKEFEVLINTD